MNGLGLHRVASRFGFLAITCVVAVAVGCAPSGPAEFTLNMNGKEGMILLGDEDAETRKEKNERFLKTADVATALKALFGTPDDPDVYSARESTSILKEMGFDVKKLRQAAGPVWSDEEGKHHGLFRRHCVHCHGITGDGAGPTAVFLNPYPRDFRQGKYKFKSTERAAKPTRGDLRRTLEQGIHGTAMPSFLLLDSDELDALVEYVIYLSVRGQTEMELFALIDSDEEIQMDKEALFAFGKSYKDQWDEAEQSIVNPSAPREPLTGEALAASIERGRTLFYDTARTKCFSCHGVNGLGDKPDVIYDDWNDPKKEVLAKNPSNGHEVIGKLYELPIQPIRPRNLRLGVFRGGRRPIDLYRRLYSGINGTPMPELKGLLTGGTAPAAPGAPAAPVGLKEEDLWSLVDYVLHLQYESLDVVPTVEDKKVAARVHP